MKKILSLVLCTIMLLGAFSGCAPQSGETESTQETTLPPPEHVLKVGYGRVDVTPRESIPLGGLSNSVVGGSVLDRMHTDVRNPLYATCIALTDENDYTLLIYHLDFLNAYNEVFMQAKVKIVRATGIPGNQIMICTTHNHSGPALSATSSPVIEDYNTALANWMADAAVEALADRKPAKTYVTSTIAENMNFVRHYNLSDGTVAGDNFGSFKNNTILGHYREVDDEMQLIKFTREGGKDVILMNWQGHPTGHGDFRYSILSCVDETRKVIEKELDCHFAYFLGGSGNVNSSSRIKSEQIPTTGVYYEALYQKLAMVAKEASVNFRQVETSAIKLLYQEYAAVDITDETVTRIIPMHAFSFGDVAFVTAPYEMFCESGMQIKEESPFEMTFVSTCSNGSLSYIPTLPTFDYNSYEVQMTKFVPGTAEKLVTEYISMLNQIHG